MKKYDIVIIGGGVIGTAIAHELSKYKISIGLLEKEEELSFGVSKSNSGIIHSGAGISQKLLKGRLCIEGNQLITTLFKELDIDFKQVGAILVAFNQTELEILKKIQKDCEIAGIRQTKIVDKHWLKEHEPNLNPEISYGLWTPSTGILSPYRLVYAMARNAMQNGVDVWTMQKVVKISKSGNLFSIVTTKEIFTSPCVINAAGLYADEISKMVGLNYFVIKPRKGEEYILDKKRESMVRHLIFPVPGKKTKGILIIKTSDGNPMIGPTAEEVRDKQDLSTTDEGLEKVLQSACRMMPWITKADIISYFAGLRPVAMLTRGVNKRQVQEDFIIKHEDKVPGFINVAGIQSPGLTAAPAIGKMVSGLINKNCFKLEKKKFFQRYLKKTTHLFAVPLSKTKNLIKKDNSYGDIICRCELVSAREIRDAIQQGARTLDGIKFRTRAGAGRCHGSFCTIRTMKILSDELQIPLTDITKRGKGSEILKGRG